MIAAEPLPRALAVNAQRLALAGCVLGGLATWVALPPVHARTVAVPLALAAAGASAGVLGWFGGARRLGISATVVAALSVALSWLATQSSVEHLQEVFTWSTLTASALVFATPLTYAALGGMFSERSGVVNIGLEGMMLMGAFWGIYGADRTDSWLAGVLIGTASGALTALLHAFFSIHLRADQIVAGTAINFLALGITGYFFVDLYSGQNIPSGVPRIPNVNLRFLEHVPPHTSWHGRELDLGAFLYQSIGHLNLMIWLAIALVPLSWFALFRTTIGLRLRACGEHPRAADTVGISVYGVRYGAVVLSGALAALGGAFLSVGFVGTFNENMTNGRGFIALAAMIFGNWRPFGAFFAALLFGFSEALAFLMQVYSDSVPGIDVLVNTLPYVLTLIAVAGVIGRTTPPAADGKAYRKQ